MMQLSKNFDSSEFACGCGCGYDSVSIELVNGLQKLRDLIDKPVNVTSGCRCKKHNEAIGGSPNSYHLLGMAADVTVWGMDPRSLYHYAEYIGMFRNGGIGIYPENGFVHVDMRGDYARWARVGGEYVSIFEVLV